MALELTPTALRDARTHTVEWTRTLDHLPSMAGRYADYDAIKAAELSRISGEAVQLAWDTPSDIAARAPKLLDYLNGVAYHAGRVDEAGNPKVPDLDRAAFDARRANVLVQHELWNADPNEPRDFLW